MSAAASVADLEAHRAALTGRCYRMLGSAADADDAVQDTMVRAWKGLDRFDSRASLRTWLYRIATNVCLDALAGRKRRFRPIDEGSVGTPEDELAGRPRTHWLEPIADKVAISAGECLDTTVPAVSSALQRARASMRAPRRITGSCTPGAFMTWMATTGSRCGWTQRRRRQPKSERARLDSQDRPHGSLAPDRARKQPVTFLSKVREIVIVPSLDASPAPA